MKTLPRGQLAPLFSRPIGIGSRLTRGSLWIAFLTLMSVAQTKASAASNTGFLLVANKGNQTLNIIDPATGKLIASVEEHGATGHEVAASLDGQRAFVPIYGTGGVGGRGTDGSMMRVIDVARGEVIGTVDFGQGVRPHCVKVGQKTGLLYVTTELLQAVTIVDPTTLKVVGSVPTGRPESHMLAISRDERRGYTVNVGSGTVSVLDLENRKLITTIAVCADAQRIALSADEKHVFTADQKQPRIAVIDTATNQVASWITLPSIGFGSTTTPDGKWLIVTLASANKVAVVDLSAMKVTQTIDLPRAPQEALVRPDGGAIYVSCDAARQVAEIDPQTWTVKQLIPAGPTADGLAWAPTAQK